MIILNEEIKRCFCGWIADFKTDKTIRDFHSGAKYMCSECAEDLSDRTKGKICKYLERL